MDNEFIWDPDIISLLDLSNDESGKKRPFFSLFQAKEDFSLYEEILKSIPANPRIAWYPSAGSDFSDIRFFGHVAPSVSGMIEPPDVYVHTDYAFNGYTFKPAENGLRQEFPGHFLGNMEIQILQSCRLEPARGINPGYHVDARLATFPDDASPESVITLYDIAYQTKEKGRTYRGRTLVLYAHWENLNFMSNFLAATSSKVNYLFHEVDGCGFGGGLLPMNDALFPFLRPLGVEAVHTYRPEFRAREAWIESVSAETGWQPELYELDPLFKSIWLVRECSEPWSPDVLSKIWKDAVDVAENAE